MGSRRAGAATLALAVLLAVTGCSSDAASSAGPSTGPTVAEATPSDTESVPTDAATPTGTEAIFDISAVLHPGKPAGGTVPTKVVVTVTNIGTVPSALTGTPTLSDKAGHDYLPASGHPEGPGLDFGTVAPGAAVTRSYAVDLPVGAAITTILVEPDGGVGVDGPVTTAR